MTKFTEHLWFKTVAVFLVISFITLDIAWANPLNPSESATLGVPSLFQAMQAEVAAKSLAINGIGKFLLGDEESGDKPFELKYLQSTLSAEIRRGLDGIDLSKIVLKENGIILIPFENERGKFLFQVAHKDNPAAKEMAGFEGGVSDKYIVKVAARSRAGQAAAKPVAPRRGGRTHPGKSPADALKLIAHYIAPDDAISAPKIRDLYIAHWKEYGFEAPANDPDSVLRTAERDLYEAEGSLFKERMLEEFSAKGENGERLFKLTANGKAKAAQVKGRVLVVDDESSVRNAIGSILGMAGYEVMVASSAEEALQVLEAKNCDIVVTDLRMPGKDGIQFASEMKKRKGKDIPVMILSAYTGQSDESLILALEAGVIDFVMAKPISMDTLAIGVGALLRSYRLKKIGGAIPAIPASQARVLVVDDEPLVKNVFKRILAREGYQVVTASDAEEALEKLQEPGSKFDIVLTDLRMPGKNGVEVAREAKKRGSAVMLVSGSVSADQEMIMPAVGEGYIDIVVEKPASLTAIKELVASLLKISSLAAQAEVAAESKSREQRPDKASLVTEVAIGKARRSLTFKDLFDALEKLNSELKTKGYKYLPRKKIDAARQEVGAALKQGLDIFYSEEASDQAHQQKFIDLHQHTVDLFLELAWINGWIKEVDPAMVPTRNIPEFLRQTFGDSALRNNYADLTVLYRGFIEELSRLGDTDFSRYLDADGTESAREGARSAQEELRNLIGKKMKVRMVEFPADIAPLALACFLVKGHRSANGITYLSQYFDTSSGSVKKKSAVEQALTIAEEASSYRFPHNLNALLWRNLTLYRNGQILNGEALEYGRAEEKAAAKDRPYLDPVDRLSSLVFILADIGEYYAYSNGIERIAFKQLPEQPRNEDGTYGFRGGKSPEGAIVIIALSDELQKAPFNITKYMEVYEKEVARHPELRDERGLKFESTISRSTAERDLSALTEFDRGILRPASFKKKLFEINPKHSRVVFEKRKALDEAAENLKRATPKDEVINLEGRRKLEILSHYARSERNNEKEVLASIDAFTVSEYGNSIFLIQGKQGGPFARVYRIVVTERDGSIKIYGPSANIDEIKAARMAAPESGASETVNTYLPDPETLARANLKSALQRISDSMLAEKEKIELDRIVNITFDKALPYFEEGAQGNPVYHNTQVLYNMARIGLEEGMPYKELKNALILALIHDIGNAASRRRKVKDDEVEDAMHAKDRRGAAKLARMAIGFRLEHMEKGPALAREALEPLLEEHLISKDDADIICKAISIHDNPSVEESARKMRSLKVVVEYPLGQFLFSFDGSALARLITVLREADRLFMVSYQGVVKDLLDGKERVAPETITGKLESNIAAHRAEYDLYVRADKDDGKFLGKSLYRTQSGYGMFKEARGLIKKEIAERSEAEGVPVHGVSTVSGNTTSNKARANFFSTGIVSAILFFMFQANALARPVIIQAPSPQNGWTLTIKDLTGTSNFNIEFSDQDLTQGLWSVASNGVPAGPLGITSWQDDGTRTLTHPSAATKRFYRTKTMIVDGTLPSASIAINYDAAYAESRDVTVSVNATDSPSGLGQVRFSVDAGATWTPYTSFGANSNVTQNIALSQTRYGPMEVQAQVVDNSANVKSVKDSVILIPTNQQGFIDSNMAYFLPTNNTVDAASGYPREGYSLTTYTQPTSIGFYAELLANVVSGDIVTDQMSSTNALSSLSSLVNSLRSDQTNSAIGYKGLLPWMAFSGSNRVRASGAYGQQVMFGDNVNLSVALASAIGSLSKPALDGDPTVQAIKQKIEDFLEAQREGYEFLYNNSTGGWNFISGTPVGSLPSYFCDEFRGGVMFAMLRYGLPDAFYANLNVHIRSYQLIGGETVFTVAPYDGGAFQMLWPSFTPEADNPILSRMLQNYLTVALDFSSKSNLPGLPSASYIAPNTYSGNAGIDDIAYIHVAGRDQSAAPLYPFGPAYQLNPSIIQQRVLDALRAHPSLVSNHGMWEGYYAGSSSVVTQQISANVASFIIGLAGKASDNLAAYYDQKGLTTRMQSIYAQGNGVDLISAATAVYQWGSAAGSSSGGQYTMTSGAFTDSGTAFIQNYVNISGGQLRIRYKSTTAVGDGQIELKQLTNSVLYIKSVIKTIHFENTGGAEREVLIDLPVTPAISDIREVVLSLYNGNGTPLNFTITNLEIIQGSSGKSITTKMQSPVSTKTASTAIRASPNTIKKLATALVFSLVPSLLLAATPDGGGTASLLDTALNRAQYFGAEHPAIMFILITPIAIGLITGLVARIDKTASKKYAISIGGVSIYLYIISSLVKAVSYLAHLRHDYPVALDYVASFGPGLLLAGVVIVIGVGIIFGVARLVGGKKAFKGLFPETTSYQPDLAAITAEALQKLEQYESISHLEAFEIVESSVPKEMKALRQALEQLKPIVVSGAIYDSIDVYLEMAQGEHKLSDGETRILKLALLWPGQGNGFREEGDLINPVGWDLQKAAEEVALMNKNLAFIWDPDLEAVHRVSKGIMKGDIPLTPQSYADLVAGYKAYLAGNEQQKANSAQYGLAPNERVVYFCMEYGLIPPLNTYGGGLGILAGDHLRGASDRYSKDTFVGVGLAWNKGYFQQAIEPSGRSAGEQVEKYPDVPIERYGERVKIKDNDGRETDLVVKVEVPDGKNIYAKAWRVRVGRTELYLLDTDIPENDSADAQPFCRALTRNLYAANEREWRFKQEYLLGIGGMRLLQQIGIRPAALHINEGHAAFSALELIQCELAEKAKALNLSPAEAVDMRKSDPERARALGISFEQAMETIRAKIGFTSHTPIPAGNEEFEPGLFYHYFRHYCMLHGLDISTLVKVAVYPSAAYGGADMANLSKLAIALSADVSAEEAAKPIRERSIVTRNGVSRKGGEVSKDLYGDESFGAITNSVHRKFWQSPIMQDLLEARWMELQKRNAVPNKKIELLSREERPIYLKVLMDSITNEELLQAQRRMKEDAVKHLAQIRGITLDKDAFTTVVSRRFASYKRLGMILGIDDTKSVMEEDFNGQVLDKLIQEAQEKGLKLQIVFAGKAHAQDQSSKDIIAKINKAATTQKWKDVIVFVPNYDIDVAMDLIQIGTVWMNNPVPPFEASGTSGEKAAANGVMSVSTPDGWVIEADPRSTVFLFGKEGHYDDLARFKDVQLRRELDKQDLKELEELFLGSWRDQGTEREKGIIDMYRYHPDRWAERVRGTIYDFLVNFDMPRFIEDYEQKMYLPLVLGGRAKDAKVSPADGGAAQMAPESKEALDMIILSAEQELASKIERSHEAQFALVRSRVPEDMARLATALDELNQAFLQNGMKDLDAMVGAKEKYGLSVEEAKVVWLAFLWPGQGIGDAEQPEKAEAAAPADAGVKELFEIVEGTINNERARVVKLANQLMDHLAQGVSDGHVKVEDTAAEIKASANDMAVLAENLAAPWDDEGAQEMASELRKSMGQFEADSIVGAIIILARRAKFQNQKLIIGLETDWIPGYNEPGSLQQNAISSLVNEVASLDKTLLSMGLENVVIVHKSKDELAMAISYEATRTNTKLTNIVLFGSNTTFNSDAFAALRSTPGEARAFMAAVDPSELNAFYKDRKDSLGDQLKIRLMEMLCMALELAVGKEPPLLPIIASYDKVLRTVTFLPKIEPADYEEIRRFYNAARAALQAA